MECLGKAALAFLQLLCSCSAGGVPPILRAGSHEEGTGGCFRCPVALATLVVGGFHCAWQPTQRWEAWITPKSFRVLSQAPPPSSALSSHRHLLVCPCNPHFLFPPGLSILSSFGSPVCYYISGIFILCFYSFLPLCLTF